MVESQSFHDSLRVAMGGGVPQGIHQVRGKRDGERFPNGQIFIHLKRNKLSYFPGDKIEGSVMV